MQDNTRDEKEFLKLGEKVLAAFSQEGFESFEVTKGGLVTITMDGNFRVIAILIQNVNLEHALLKQLEQAIQNAMNQAIQEVARRHGEQLMAALGEQG